jgi:mono/diheme cytochrome c family protein
MKAVAVCVLVLALGSAPGAQDQAKIDQAIRKASGEGIADELPPLSEARAAGRLKSMYLKPATATKAPSPAGDPTANLEDFKTQVAPSFKTACVTCHGPEKQKGKFRVDTLNPDLLKGGDINRWLDVFKLVSNGEMPPEEAKGVRLTEQQRNILITWLGSELQKASQVRQTEQGQTSFRRMTRYEYNYALQDLTGLPYDFSDLLPPETASKDGFLNSSPLLQMTGMQFERYRELGLKALRKATVRGERPQTSAYLISMQDMMSASKQQLLDLDDKNARKVNLVNRETGKGLLFKEEYKPKRTLLPDALAAKSPAVSPVVLVLGPNQSIKLNLGETLPDEGLMRVRLRAGRTSMESDDYVSVRLIFSAHTSNNANFSEVISKRDLPVTAPSDKPQFIQFDIPLSEITRNPFRKKGGPLGRPDEFLSIQVISSAGSKSGGKPTKVCADYIEIIAPFYEQWPPKTHTDIFIESRNKGDEKQYGTEVLTQFMTRAWRRPVSAVDVAPYLSLFSGYRPGFATFEEAMLEVLSTTLAAPDFLYLTQKKAEKGAKNPNGISDLELASRLSFFLWCSIPDQELLNLARQGKLSDPKTLTDQAKRLLADPRSQRFSKTFVDQWLGLNGLDHVHVDEKLFTGVYDSALKDAMQEEPIAFFNEVLHQNRSIMDFLHSDYILVNERLAKHYKVPGVTGPEFRKVAIDQKTNRGGLLTGAGILTMNSDGKDSHTVKRGVWVLNKILNDPPPPPPPNVPQVDLTNPDILKMTLKDRIADHREKAACYSCHSKIDPWGIAFESYDAVGAYRTHIGDKPVDATSVLFNKQSLAGMDGLKRYLLADRQDQFARAMVHKLLTFALGRPLSFSDRADIDSLTEQFRKQDDHLGNLITLIVASPLFHSQ